MEEKAWFGGWFRFRDRRRIGLGKCRTWVNISKRISHGRLRKGDMERDAIARMPMVIQMSVFDLLVQKPLEAEDSLY